MAEFVVVGRTFFGCLTCFQLIWAALVQMFELLPAYVCVVVAVLCLCNVWDMFRTWPR